MSEAARVSNMGTVGSWVSRMSANCVRAKVSAKLHLGRDLYEQSSGDDTIQYVVVQTMLTSGNRQDCRFYYVECVGWWKC